MSVCVWRVRGILGLRETSSTYSPIQPVWHATLFKSSSVCVLVHALVTKLAHYSVY